MDENSEQIFDQLRPLFVYLLEQGIENYVQSSNFRNMCILNKWEGIWEQSCTKAELKSMSTSIFGSRNIKINYNFLYFLTFLSINVNTFIQNLRIILIDFINWRGRKIDSQYVAQLVLDLKFLQSFDKDLRIDFTTTKDHVKDESGNKKISEIIIDEKNLSKDTTEEEIMAGNMDIVIIHGRDETLLTEIKLFLEKCSLPYKVLKDHPTDCRSTMERFLEISSCCSYAIVLFTPDDIGGLLTEVNTALSSATNISNPIDFQSLNMNSRARQNVVLEIGLAIAIYGRKNVFILNTGVDEIPSDLSGATYSIKEEWRNKLMQSLLHANYDIDSKKVILEGI